MKFTENMSAGEKLTMLVLVLIAVTACVLIIAYNWRAASVARTHVEYGYTLKHVEREYGKRTTKIFEEWQK